MCHFSRSLCSSILHIGKNSDPYSDPTHFQPHIQLQALLISTASPYCPSQGFPDSLVVKNLPVNAEDTRCESDPWVGKIPWRRGPLEATHSSILAWRSPWTEEPGGLQSTGWKKSDTAQWLSTPRPPPHYQCNCFNSGFSSLSPSPLNAWFLSLPQGFSLLVNSPLIAQLVRIHLQCRRPWFDPWVGKIPWRRDRLPTPVFLGFPCGPAGKESAYSARDLGLILGLRKSPREGTGYPLQYLGLENSMDCIVHGGRRVGHDTERVSLSLCCQSPFWDLDTSPNTGRLLTSLTSFPPTRHLPRGQLHSPRLAAQAFHELAPAALFSTMLSHTPSRHLKRWFSHVPMISRGNQGSGSGAQQAWFWIQASP